MNQLRKVPLQGAGKPLRGGFKALLEEDPRTVSVSIRPMDELFTYQVFSLSNALAYLRERPQARLRVDLADLEFDMQRGLGFLPYSRDSRSDETAERLIELVGTAASMEPSMSGRVAVRKFSEWLSIDPGLLDHVSRLFEKERARAAKLLISRKTGKNTHLPVAPICPSCSHASASFGVISSARDSLEAECRFQGCSDQGKRFSIDVRTPGSYCLFYLFDSVADAYDDPLFGRTGVHMLGIDAERQWAKRMPVYEVVSRLTALLTDDGYSPSYYFAMRLDEMTSKSATSLSKRSRFDDFLSRSGLSPLSALERFCDISASFDGLKHAAMDDLLRQR